MPTSWSADGRWLVLTELSLGTRGDILVLDLVEGGAPEPFLATEYEEREGAFSSDGQLIAYTSNEAGRYEVYVQPFPGPGRKLQVSTDGGNQPVWSPDGRELFYRDGDRMMVAAIARRPLNAEAPRQLFEARFEDGYTYHPRVYDVVPGGDSFVVARSDTAVQFDRVRVIVDWLQELRRAVPEASPR